MKCHVVPHIDLAVAVHVAFKYSLPGEGEQYHVIPVHTFLFDVGRKSERLDVFLFQKYGKFRNNRISILIEIRSVFL